MAILAEQRVASLTRFDNECGRFRPNDLPAATRRHSVAPEGVVVRDYQSRMDLRRKPAMPSNAEPNSSAAGGTGTG